VTQADWQRRLVNVLAGEVRRRRKELKMSARQLSEACEKRGVKLPRSVLANLESGRRPYVSVAEWLALAAALGVPPSVLLFPVGRGKPAEVPPSGPQDPLNAISWLSGLALYPHDESVTDLGDVELFQVHRVLIDRRPSQRDWAENEKDTAMYRIWEGAVQLARQQLRTVRAIMRDRGLIPPQVPQELAEIDVGGQE